MHTYFDTRLAQCHPKQSQGSNKKYMLCLASLFMMAAVSLGETSA